MFDWIEPLIERHGPQRVIEAVGPFLSEARTRRIEQVLDGRLGWVWAAVERPQDPHNAAAVVRTSEALGAMRVDVIAATDDALCAPRTTQGAFHWVQTYHHGTLDSFLASFARSDVLLAGAAMGGECALEELPLERPVCVLLGNESSGLSRAALDACDTTFRIPMYGMSESLNLSVSAALALYSLAGRKRAELGRPGDLDEPARLRERARCYARAVQQRLAVALLEP